MSSSSKVGGAKAPPAPPAPLSLIDCYLYSKRIDTYYRLVCQLESWNLGLPVCREPRQRAADELHHIAWQPESCP